MVTAEVMMTRARCDDQSIVGQSTAVQQDAPIIHVDTISARSTCVFLWRLRMARKVAAMLAGESQPVAT